MFRTRVAVFAVALTGAAVAQPPRPAAPAGVPLATRLPSHLHDAALVAELKLTPEQVKTLAPRGPSKGGSADDAPASAGTRVKEALTPEQYARAVQLMAQDALRRGGVATPAALAAVPVSTFRRYPELADAAKLTREQRRRVAAAAPQPNPNFGGQPTDASYGGLPGAAHVLLEPEQTAALTAFVGPLRAAPFGTAPPPTPPGGTGRPVTTGTVPAWQRAMTAVNNRGELKLTDEQTTTLSTLMNAARGIVRPSPDGTVPTPPRPQTPAETEAALAKALTTPQMTRLKQIELWQLLPPGADATAKFDLPRVASEVALDDDQKGGLKAVAAAHRDQAAAALRSAKTAEDLRVALAAARAATAAGVEKLLTDEQRTTLGELFGAEYRGGGGGGRPDNDIFRRIRAASYGHYQFEIMLPGRFAGVAEDLRLTEAQKAALSAAERDYNQGSRQGLNYDAPEHELAKQMAAQSKVMQKAFDDVFNPEQKKRFRELCVQCRQELNTQQMNNGNGGMYPPTGVPGVADELKLTADQRKRIIETGDEDATLTAEQRSVLKRLTGPPLAGGFDFGFGGRGRGRAAPPSARLALLYAGTAHADLRLTAEQTHLIAETIEQHAAELRPATTGRTGELGGYVEPPQPEAVADTVAACEKACHSVLTAAQRARLGQLVLQAAAEASLTAAFARPEVAEKLAFTAEQRAALADVGADFRGRVAAVNGLPNSAGWPELRRQALTDARSAARTRLMAVLTAEQSAAWRALTGPACPAVAALPPSGDDTRDP